MKLILYKIYSNFMFWSSTKPSENFLTPVLLANSKSNLKFVSQNNNNNNNKLHLHYHKSLQC